MKAALIQSSRLQGKLRNKQSPFSEKIIAIAEDIKLIVLRALQWIHNEVAETMQGETVSWIRALAKTKNT
jgi:hypothetical protein